jgi:two-component system cell cycle sensor histidine kinase/response regulator CckA
MTSVGGKRPSLSSDLSEVSYRKVIDGVRDAVAVEDPAGNIVYANKVFMELFELEPADMADLKIEPCIAPEWREELLERHECRMRGEEVPDKFEFEGVKQRSGDRMWLQIHVLKILEDGECVGTQSVIRDVTQTRRDEAQLRRVNRDLAGVIEALPLAINVLDRDANVRMWNAAAERLFGYSKDEVLGNVYPLAPGELNVEHRKMLAKAITSGKAYSGYEATRQRKDGSSIDVAIWSAPMRDEEGNIQASLAVMADIRERLRAQQDYRHLFENARDSLVIFDPVTEEVYQANPRALDMYGFTRDELIGMSLKAISVDVSRGRAAIESTLVKKTSDNFQTVHRHKDGHELALEANASIVQYRGKPAILAILRDHTERRKLEAELRRAQRLEAVGQLAAGVAHDFNNILAAILSGAEHLGNQAKDEATTQLVQEIVAATERGSRLTRQLLAFSRKQVLKPTYLDAGEVLVEMAQWLTRLLDDNIELELDIPPADASIHVDPGQFDQVVVNLAVNARDAMPDGGTLTIGCGCAEFDDEQHHSSGPLAPGRYVRISVTDSGEGITAQVRSRMFDPFFTTKSDGKGSGMGLATVDGIVGQLGGSIMVHSEIGQGTRFDVYLLNEEGDLAPASVRPQEIAHGSETILLVEDDAGVRRAMRRVLAAAGYDVLVAQHAAEAEALFHQHGSQVDVLLTDVNMPGLSGPALARRLRAQFPDLPVIFMSGYVGETQHGELAHDPVLEKPVTQAALTVEVRRALTEKKTKSDKPEGE